MAETNPGVRLICVQEGCEAEFIVTRGGDDELVCHDQAMQLKDLTASKGGVKSPPFAPPAKSKCNQCDKDAVFQHPYGPWFCSTEHELKGVNENAERVNALGKRYRCYTSGAEALCLKPGDSARVDCKHKTVWLDRPKVLPSAD